MNLRKLTLLVATPWLLSLGGVAAFGEVSGCIMDVAADFPKSSDASEAQKPGSRH